MVLDVNQGAHRTCHRHHSCLGSSRLENRRNALEWRPRIEGAESQISRLNLSCASSPKAGHGFYVRRAPSMFPGHRYPAVTAFRECREMKQD